jgi:hypothetical protein
MEFSGVFWLEKEELPEWKMMAGNPMNFPPKFLIKFT